MKIYLIRHGETDYGKKNFTTGHTDIPLNETGKEQAKSTAIFLKEKGISKIFSSSLRRASETALIIASELDLSVVEYDELMERSSGKLDGVPFTDFFDTLKRVGNFETMILQAGGEPLNEFKERVWNKFLEITQKHYDHEIILIVAHGEVIRLILAEIFKSPYPPISLRNCDINIIEYDTDRDDGFKFIIHLINYTDHLD